MKYKVALVQMDSGDDLKVNLSKVERFCGEAAAAGADLVVFPERSEYVGRGTRKVALPIPGETAECYRRLAMRYGIYVHCGSIAERIEVDEDARPPYNTSLLYGPDGSLLAKYRKLHLFQVEIPGGLSLDEHRNSTEGDRIVAADTELGRFGMTICYDLRFPELYRSLATGEYENTREESGDSVDARGVDAFFIPANFTWETGEVHWETLLKARAIENTCYVLAAGQCGQKPKYRAYGHSMIIDPWGVVLAEAGAEEEIIYAEIDTDRIRQVREQMPSLANRRPEIYKVSQK